MGESAVIIRYALALYSLAREAGRTDEILQDLARLKEALDQTPRAWGRILDPRSGSREKAAFLEETLMQGRDRLVVNFLGVLLARHRISLLKDFFKIYLRVHEQGQGLLRVQVESATQLEQDELAVLKEKLGAITGKTVILEPRVDANLLAGVRFIVDSRVVDGSLRHRLERLQKGLKAVKIGS